MKPLTFYLSREWENQEENGAEKLIENMLLLLWISSVTIKDREFQIFLQNIAVLKLFGLPNLVQRHEYYYILFFQYRQAS